MSVEDKVKGQRNLDLGTTSDVAVKTATTGSLIGHIRGIKELIIDKIGITIADGDDSSLGATTDAAVKTAATGSLIAHLRGLKELVIDKITANIQIGGVTPQLDDTDKIAVSIYGDLSAAGDTPIELVTGSGHNMVKVTAMDYGGNAIWGKAPGDGATVGSGLPSTTYPQLYNGGTFDRQRNNEELTLLASAARTAETPSPLQTNYNGQGLIIFVDWTVETDTVTLTPRLEIQDSISGDYFTIWTAAAGLTAIGHAVYLFVPGGAAGSYTEAVNLRIARDWRFVMGVGDTDEATYSVSAVVLV